MPAEAEAGRTWYYPWVLQVRSYIPVLMVAAATMAITLSVYLLEWKSIETFLGNSAVTGKGNSSWAICFVSEYFLPMGVFLYCWKILKGWVGWVGVSDLFFPPEPQKMACIA
jgi:hypothetical protein